MSEIVVLGDSHTAAIDQALQAQGRASRLLFLSGNHWHSQHIRPHPKMGMTAAWRTKMHQSVKDFARASGGSVFPKDGLALVSVGYHMGRLAPLFARRGHSADADHADETDKIFVSDAFLSEWILSHREGLFRILRMGARHCDIVVIAPPVLNRDPNVHVFSSLITKMLRGYGLKVFDPREETDWMAHPLPGNMRSPDNVHGTAAYGQEVLRRLEARAWLPPVLTPEAAS